MNAVLHLGYASSSLTGKKKWKYSNQPKLAVLANIENPGFQSKEKQRILRE